MLNNNRIKQEFTSKLKASLGHKYNVNVEFGPLTISLNILNIKNNKVTEYTLTEGDIEAIKDYGCDYVISALLSALGLKKTSAKEHKKWLVDERKKDRLNKNKTNKPKKTSVLT